MKTAMAALQKQVVFNVKSFNEAISEVLGSLKETTKGGG
jgi:hypothetical protein